MHYAIPCPRLAAHLSASRSGPPLPAAGPPLPCAGPPLPSAAVPRKRVVFVVRGRPGPLDRPPLPPGHADSWGLITDGTIVHQAAYTIPTNPGPKPRLATAPAPQPATR